MATRCGAKDAAATTSAELGAACTVQHAHTATWFATRVVNTRCTQYPDYTVVCSTCQHAKMLKFCLSCVLPMDISCSRQHEATVTKEITVLVDEISRQPSDPIKLMSLVECTLSRS